MILQNPNKAFGEKAKELQRKVQWIIKGLILIIYIKFLIKNIDLKKNLIMAHTVYLPNTN